MNKLILKCAILVSLLLCLVPAKAYTDNTVSGSFTVTGSRIIDLAVVEPNYTTLTLTWTSPQNSPNWGPATQYDIRYSLSPITNETWDSATQLANPPDPLPPGSPETLLVIGLNSCTTYYFAIKAADSAGIWTPLSNSPNGTTLCYPTIGGGAGGTPPLTPACPLTLEANMQGNVTTASMTSDGVLCDACLAKDPSGKNTLELEKDTKVTIDGNKVPSLLKIQIASLTLPTEENTVVVSPVYEFGAFSSPDETTPSTVSISPPATLILSFDPGMVPTNNAEVFIANYDTQEGWLALGPVPGAVAEIGKAHGLVNHFSLFAVIAKVEESAPASFEVSNLNVNPPQIELNNKIDVSIDVANTGSKSGDYELELAVDGAIKSSTRVTVAAGKGQTVNFTVNGDSVGKHQVEVAGLVGEFEVVNAAAPITVNWWLIGSLTGIFIVLAIWSILGWTWFKERKKNAAASSKQPPKPN